MMCEAPGCGFALTPKQIKRLEYIRRAQDSNWGAYCSAECAHYARKRLYKQKRGYRNGKSVRV